MVVEPDSADNVVVLPTVSVGYNSVVFDPHDLINAFRSEVGFEDEVKFFGRWLDIRVYRR